MSSSLFMKLSLLDKEICFNDIFVLLLCQQGLVRTQWPVRERDSSSRNGIRDGVNYNKHSLMYYFPGTAHINEPCRKIAQINQGFIFHLKSLGRFLKVSLVSRIQLQSHHCEHTAQKRANTMTYQTQHCNVKSI